MENFDVIVVGGGPAGLSAALSAAKAGMKTVVIERGDYPGTKNVMGGVLYTKATEAVVPDFWQSAPLERPVIEQRYGFLSGDETILAGYRDPVWAQAPYNAHTVLRVKFDRWLAQQAEKAGVMIITETVVEDLLYKGDNVVGVRTGRAEGDLGAKVVILAEGVNAFIAKKAGLAPQMRPDTVAVAVKEIIQLPQEKLEDRFCLEPGQGATIELFGDSTQGMMGTAFIYTNKDSLSIGVGALLEPLIRTKWTPNDLLEALKAKPYVKRLIQGGETKEYLAHLIPEGGYNAMPKLHRQGVLVVGDTAMLVNGLNREGSNLAMTSGKMAGEVAAQCIQSGDLSDQGMSLYEQRMRDSFVVKDLYKFRRLGRFFETHPHFLKVYPEIAANAMHLYFTADETSKKERQKQIMKMVFEKRAKGGLVSDVFGAWRAILK
ncbi:Pyridine nucleotide disulphide reductase class-I [Acididesulfobacillus acetoxydans]|uniref:Protein FixC n=1 Tax=Acididesulfobacillus acetoxydans TaxID=1561005 RepID=A0A8S0VXG4_9FIRM|nr:FAD-dependent oxidoreductase [Acididesulfobacillus acetoxydans]CAA7601873.1 Pyridine nucleotide disulphide reductase class-I [Acididesulfobacillus acetoxydans]CEJ08283.1 Protein FixC [Acididesulfobacillus acetoxydans]